MSSTSMVSIFLGRFRENIFLGVVGIALCALGLATWGQGSSIAIVVESFAIVVGAQAVLWSVGIRLEILGTTTEASSESGQEPAPVDFTAGAEALERLSRDLQEATRTAELKAQGEVGRLVEAVQEKTPDVQLEWGQEPAPFVRGSAELLEEAKRFYLAGERNPNIGWVVDRLIKKQETDLAQLKAFAAGTMQEKRPSILEAVEERLAELQRLVAATQEEVERVAEGKPRQKQ